MPIMFRLPLDIARMVITVFYKGVFYSAFLVGDFYKDLVIMFFWGGAGAVMPEEFFRCL